MDDEKECRVCREGDDDGQNTLYAPCLCSGSILYCHEECLVEWLKRSGKDFCELCKTKYVFQPKYAPHTPEVLPKNEVIAGVTRMVMMKFIPQILRVSLALVAWLIIMPCITSTLYRSLVFTYKPSHPFVYAATASGVEDGVASSKTYSTYLYNNVVSGLLLTGVIIVTFIIMMSFGDFLRSYWNLTNNPQHQQQANPLQQQQANPQQPQHQRQVNPQEHHADPLVLQQDLQAGAVNQQLYHADEHRDGVHVRAAAIARERVQHPELLENRRRPRENLQGYDDELERLLLDEMDVDTLERVARLPLQQRRDAGGMGVPVNTRQQPQTMINIDEEDFAFNFEDFPQYEALDPMQVGLQGAFHDNERTLNGTSLHAVKSRGLAEEEKKEDVDEKAVLVDDVNSDSDSFNSDDDFSDDDENEVYHEPGVQIVDEALDDNEEAGPMDGFLEALGLNNLQVELEMEMEMDGGGGLLIDDEVQEEQRLRLLQHEERLQEQARLMREEEIDHHMRLAMEHPDDNAANVMPVNHPLEDEQPFLRDHAGAAERGVGAGAGGGADGLELRLNVGELMGLAGPISSMLRCVAWMLLFNAVCIFVGYSIPSLFGYLVTRNPVKPMLHILTLGQADALVRYASGGRWGTLTALWDGVAATVISGPQSFVSLDDIWVVGNLWEWGGRVREQCSIFLGRAAATENLINIPDLLLIVAGYFVFILDSFFISYVSSLVSNHLSRGGTVALGRNVKALLQFINILVDIVKIGVLLGVRIFVLPCVIGFVIYSCWNLFLFGYEPEMLLDFCINNIIGSISVLWGMGISFMLYSTIAILQLREILHPYFLARYIRPQESQTDLLTSLLQDETPTQIKRLVVSFFVYTLLIGAFVFLPLYVVQSFGGALLDTYEPFGAEWTSKSVGSVVLKVIEMRTHYFAPELQIPLEVGLLHTAFLMFLEKFKDFIGTFEFYTIVYLSEKLRLNRFLLPYTYKKVCSLSDTVKCFDDLPPAKKLMYKDREILVVDGELVAVCAKPMMRPPAGWDARVRESTTRWAWSDDAVFDLEKSVLPNVFPGNSFEKGYVVVDAVDRSSTAVTVNKSSAWSFMWRWGVTFWENPSFGGRVLVLVIICWILAVVASMVAAMLPFVLGRAIFFAFRLPTILCHDPFAYFVGNFTMQRIIKGFEDIQVSLYGRLSTLVWNWKWQRFLAPMDDESESVTRSRYAPHSKEKKNTWWNLISEVMIASVLGCFVLPLCIGLAYNAFLLFQPFAFISSLYGRVETSSIDAGIGEPLPVDIVSILVQILLHGYEKVDNFVLLKELVRTVLLGQMVFVFFVVLVLSRHLKTVLATVGVPVLRADMEGPPSRAEEQEEMDAKARRAQHWLMRWYLMFWEDVSFAGLVKKFEWEIDCFAATFVRSSPGTVMQDHLVSPLPLRTAVTTLQNDMVVHLTVKVLRAFNNAFFLSSHTFWLVQFISCSHAVAVLSLLLRTHVMQDSTCLSSGTLSLFSVELNVMLTLLILYSLWVWLDSALSAGQHIRRGWNILVHDIHKSIKDDYYLIGKELQNSAEGLRHMASFQDSVTSTVN